MADAGCGEDSGMAELPCHGVVLSGDYFIRYRAFCPDRFHLGGKGTEGIPHADCFRAAPWIALHLFYIMILYAFSWLSAGSYAEAALPLGEAVFAHFSWVPLVSESLMLPPFLYWFYLQIRQKNRFGLVLQMV